MRRKKYKAKDKTVQKSGRDGLSEINLHNHESVNISSREKENTVRKEPESVNYQESRMRGHSTGHGKKKQYRQAGVPGRKSAETSNAGDGRCGGFQYLETAGSSPVSETASMDSQYQESVPEAAGKQAQAAKTADVCGIESEMTGSSINAGQPGNGMPASDASHKNSKLLAGTAAWGMERRQPRDAVWQELKYDAAHPAPGCNAGDSREDEKASRGQEDAPDSGMDADRQLLDERGRISGQPCRYDRMQQTHLWHAGMESIRKHPHKKQEKRQRKSRSYQRNRQDRFSGENSAGAYEEESPDDGVSAAPDNKDASGGRPDRQGMDTSSTSADGSRKADSKEKKLREKKQRLFFSSSEKTGMKEVGKEDLKDAGCREGSQTADAGNRRAGSRNTQEAAGKEVSKDAARRTGADAEKKTLPDSPEKSSRKHRQPEKGGKKNKNRLNFSEKDSGMVLGAGMGIVKHTARPLFHAIEESGSIGTDSAEESGAEPEKMYRSRGSMAAASGPRHLLRSRSFRMAGRRQCPDKGRSGLKNEKAGENAGTGTGREPQPDMGGRTGKNAESADQEKKKSIRRRQQKQRYKRRYQSEARAGIWKRWYVPEAVKPGPSGNAPSALGRKRHAVFNSYTKRKSVQWIFAAVFLLFLAGVSMLASCTALIQGTSGIAGTTYPGSDEDIRNTEARYLELENALDSQISSMEAAHPGYDGYRYQIDEISHDPYQLASYLTVICPGYTYEQAEGMLQGILENQYRLTVEERTETRTDPDTGDAYEWRVLCISLTNRGLDAVAHDRLTEEQEKLYQAYNLTHGCRDGLFGETGETGGSGIPDAGVPVVPGAALSDQRFANMLREAEKYLGYPYVWGGSSPQTSFDCSGFVSWVVNNCGNGWNVGRQTAEGLRGCCSYVAPEDARPGDLIFFQGTYNTPGASHVGIYVGNNRMIHCGSPIQYAELGNNYWNLHFLSYGRLP